MLFVRLTSNLIEFNRDVYVFMLPYSVLLLLFIYSFSLLFLLCTLGLILFFGRPTAHEQSLKIVNVPNYLCEFLSIFEKLSAPILKDGNTSSGINIWLRIFKFKILSDFFVV